jgi:hypothetical protein
MAPSVAAAPSLLASKAARAASLDSVSCPDTRDLGDQRG